jgi:hypothetical protein
VPCSALAGKHAGKTLAIEIHVQITGTGLHVLVGQDLDSLSLDCAIPETEHSATAASTCRTSLKALVAKRPMTRVGRAVEKGETQGFMKIAVDAETGAILGAAILGTGGDEVIHSILDVMYAKAPWTVIRRAMHIHPTVSELVPTMLSDLRPMD